MLVNLLLFFAAFGIVALVVGALPFSSFLFVVALAITLFPFTFVLSSVVIALVVGFVARVAPIAFVVPSFAVLAKVPP